ncbi:MAG: hypothetical protein LC722_05645, partial [Actinobacteria bacterium]|nr:hypothetical protein [Actinomycetota bacterium]
MPSPAEPRPWSRWAASPQPWFGVLAAATAGIAVMSGASPSPFVPPLPAGVRPPAALRRLAELAGLDRSTPGAANLRATLLMAAAVIAFVALLLLARRGLVSTRAAVAWSLVLIAVVAVLPPLLSRDVYSYAIYGRIWAVAGANPYLHPPIEFGADPFITVVSGEWIRSPSVYGPAFTLLSGGLVKAFGSTAATVAAFKVLAAAALGACVILAAAVGERRGRGAGAA